MWYVKYDQIHLGNAELNSLSMYLFFRSTQVISYVNILLFFKRGLNLSDLGTFISQIVSLEHTWERLPWRSFFFA